MVGVCSVMGNARTITDRRDIRGRSNLDQRMDDQHMDEFPKVLMVKIRHTFVFQKQFPLLDPAKFFASVRAKGFAYQLQPGMEFDQATGSMRRMTVGIATRDTGTVQYEPDKGWITVSNEATFGLLPSQVEGEGEPAIRPPDTHAISYSLEDLDLVRDILTKDMEIILSKSLLYTECILEAFIVGRKAPLVAFSQKLSSPLLNELSAVIGDDVAPFDVRVYPKAHTYTDMNLRKVNNWYEIRVEPLIANPRQYYVNLVYRNENHEVYVKFVRDLERILSGIIKSIEKE